MRTDACLLRPVTEGRSYKYQLSIDKLAGCKEFNKYGFGVSLDCEQPARVFQVPFVFEHLEDHN